MANNNFSMDVERDRESKHPSYPKPQEEIVQLKKLPTRKIVFVDVVVSQPRSGTEFEETWRNTSYLGAIECFFPEPYFGINIFHSAYRKQRDVSVSNGRSVEVHSHVEMLRKFLIALRVNDVTMIVAWDAERWVMPYLLDSIHRLLPSEEYQNLLSRMFLLDLGSISYLYSWNETNNIFGRHLNSIYREIVRDDAKICTDTEICSLSEHLSQCCDIYFLLARKVSDSWEGFQISRCDKIPRRDEQLKTIIERIPARDVRVRLLYQEWQEPETE